MNGLNTVKNATGESYDIAGAQWTWKVRGSQTDRGFCFFEMTVHPGQGVPLHVHGYPEAFYVLEGALEFHPGDEKGTVLNCTAGDVVLANAGNPHAFFNRSQSSARLLSISTAAHEPFFDAIVEADRDRPFASMPAEDIASRVAAIGAQTGMLFIDGS
jgi:quercetin dioxygenase-like cupin family protein